MKSDAHRASGILLHPTSLPDATPPEPGQAASAAPSLRSPGSGDFGASAYHFVDWLAAGGQQLWQVLPLGPVGPGYSPYMSPSAFALNPLLVDLHDLVAHGWLDEAAAQQAGTRARQARQAQASREAAQASAARATVQAPLPATPMDIPAAMVAAAPVAAAPVATAPVSDRIDYDAVAGFRMACLAAAAHNFFAGHEARDDYNHFCASEAAWLDDYALFMAISEQHPGMAWPDWPGALAAREHDALARARERLHDDIQFWRFVQWAAFRQWTRLKRHANDRQVRIIGDLPIFVALHSADVWAHPGLFDLDPDLRLRVVAGVPPDYFSATGQLWGNPLYRWDRHAEEGYAWWIRRVKTALAMADVVRIDHFRGFAAYWEVAADAADAIDGRWVPGPGLAFFDAVKAALDAAAGADAKTAAAAGETLGAPLPIIAEDLGVVTPDVTELREAAGLPGMRVLQFAFGDNALNPYLPHNFTRDTVVYSGTHDNDTSLGWFAAAPPGERTRVQVYLKTDGREINWDLIHAASQSVATIAIYPLQDVLGLGSEARMNRPGDADGCWGWRFQWSQVQPWHADRLRQISAAHGRNGLS